MVEEGCLRTRLFQRFGEDMTHTATGFQRFHVLSGDDDIFGIFFNQSDVGKGTSEKNRQTVFFGDRVGCFRQSQRFFSVEIRFGIYHEKRFKIFRHVVTSSFRLPFVNRILPQVKLFCKYFLKNFFG